MPVVLLPCDIKCYWASCDVKNEYSALTKLSECREDPVFIHKKDNVLAPKTFYLGGWELTWIVMKYPKNKTFNSHINNEHDSRTFDTCTDLQTKYSQSHFCAIATLMARLMGPTWDPPGADTTQVGPMLAPWTLLSGQLIQLAKFTETPFSYNPSPVQNWCTRKLEFETIYRVIKHNHVSYPSMIFRVKLLRCVCNQQHVSHSRIHLQYFPKVR